MKPRKPLKRSSLKRSQKPIPKKRVKPKREKPMELPAFPRPEDIKKEPVTVRVMKDGREVCNMLTAAGRAEYERRKRFVWEQQTFRSIGIDQPGHYCSICKLILHWKDTTADHIKPRKSGGSERDDRVENLAAAHWICNTQRGSKRSGYYGIP